jgi:hypothetical protein
MNRSGALSQSPSIDIANLDIKRNGSLYLSGGNSTVPVWVPDHEASNCMVCDKKFGIKGKHHCRNCGFVVCNSCSTTRIRLPHTAGRVRCCDRCVKDMQSKPVALPVTQSSTSSLPTSFTSPIQSPLSASSSHLNPSSTSALAPVSPVQQWKQQVEKESEMVSILEGQSNGYHSLPDLYQTSEVLSSVPLSGEVIPHDFTGVGADVPDWAYIFSTPNKSQSRFGRLRLKLHEVDQLILNNITIPQQEVSAPKPKVEYATVSAFIALGNTFHQTTPSDIALISQHDSLAGLIRSGKGYSKVDQGCVLDVCSVTQTLRFQVVLNKTTPTRVVDGYTVPEQTMAVPIGFINIPISSLKPNQVESLTLSLTPTTPQQIAALTQTPAYLRKNSSIFAPLQSSKRTTIKVDIEFICSPIGYLWSSFNTAQFYNDATAPPLSMYNIVQYSLLVLNAMRPILTTILSLFHLFSWQSPLLSLLFFLIFLFEVYYPIPMVLTIIHLLALRLLLSPLYSSDESPRPQPTEKDLFSHENVNASSLHQLAQFSPDSESTALAQQKNTDADESFVEVFIDFLSQLLPLLYPASSPSSQTLPKSQTFSFQSVSSLYSSIHSFYALFVTPVYNLLNWQVSLFVSAIAVALTSLSFLLVFIIPSHYIYISICLLPFLYNSAPIRLLRASLM